jgi:hypothetical protein
VPDTRPDTPDTAAFSIWLLVVSICVSAVAYFTAEVHDRPQAAAFAALEVDHGQVACEEIANAAQGCGVRYL